MMKQLSFVLFVLFSCYMGVHSKDISAQELKHLTHELEVHAPANEVWGLYRHLGISKLAAQQLKNVIQRIDVLEGDGGVGTMLKLTFVPGNSSYTEIFTKIDDEKMVKVAEAIQGGCLAIGCSVQIVQFDIINSTRASSIIRSDIGYAVKKGFESQNPKPNIQLLAAAAQVAKKFLEHTG